tara:strand:- start:398 stop:910 length:513 start_codon:yes stop_codon:yes gene_type:complete
MLSVKNSVGDFLDGLHDKRRTGDEHAHVPPFQDDFSSTAYHVSPGLTRFTVPSLTGNHLLRELKFQAAPRFLQGRAMEQDVLDSTTPRHSPPARGAHTIPIRLKGLERRSPKQHFVESSVGILRTVNGTAARLEERVPTKTIHPIEVLSGEPAFVADLVDLRLQGRGGNP